MKDTGIGIPLDRQEAILERFVQADISDKKALQGAGLGLSISKAYVEMLGGKIWVQSEEGKGSIFYFTIPYDVRHFQCVNHVIFFKDFITLPASIASTFVWQLTINYAKIFKKSAGQN